VEEREAEVRKRKAKREKVRGWVGMGKEGRGVRGRTPGGDGGAEA